MRDIANNHRINDLRILWELHLLGLIHKKVNTYNTIWNKVYNLDLMIIWIVWYCWTFFLLFKRYSIILETPFVTVLGYANLINFFPEYDPIHNIEIDAISHIQGRAPKMEFIKKMCIYSYMFKLQSPSKYPPFDAIYLSRRFFHCSKQFQTHQF